MKNQQPRPKGTRYVVLIRYLYSGFNTLFKRPEGRGIKPPNTNKIVGILYIVLFFTCSGVSFGTQNKIFGFDNSTGIEICIVDGNTARFYVRNWNDDLNTDVWIELKYLIFDLPDGYDDVFAIDRYFCIVIENTVRFYKFDYGDYGNSNIGRWAETTWYTAFDLPSGYDSVFGFWVSGAVLGVVFENTARFYNFHYEWKESEDMDSLVLPHGYNNAYGFYNNGKEPDEIIAVNLQNRVRFYEFNKRCGRHGWEELTEMIFDSPNGYKVFHRYGSIGLSDGNSIKFFGFDNFNNRWVEYIPSPK
jgi:hypothetical protein